MSSQPATKILYVGTMAVSAVTLAMVTIVVRRDRNLRDSDEAPDLGPALVAAVAFLLALVVMLLFPRLSYWPMLILLVRRLPLPRRRLN